MRRAGRVWCLALGLTLALLGPVGTAVAQAMRVTSGDHEGFTRLVVPLPGPADWQLGRTAEGYELRLPGPAPTYDLSQVFRPIGRDRLAAIWADPATGALQLGVACACHALPFELRPGLVVIDIRDGPAPAGSSFEVALDGTARPALSGRPVPRPRPRPMPPDGMPAPAALQGLPEALRRAARIDIVAPDLTRLEDAAGRLGPMRAALIADLARGASAGLVQMAAPAADGLPGLEAPAANLLVRDGRFDGLRIGLADDPTQALMPDGAACPPDALFDLVAWAPEDPPAQALAQVATGLVGEFDRPDPAERDAAVRLLLYLGFGAEARGVIQAFPVPEDPSLPGRDAAWTGLALVLDGEPVPLGAALTRAAGCDGPAAMWAALAAPPASSRSVNGQAVRQAFSALPLHLRRHLGPPLMDRFGALGDRATLRAIQDAVLRPGGDPGQGVTLASADAALALGEAAQAEAMVTPLATGGGPASAAALVTLVEARIAQALPVDAATVLALRAHLSERKGTDQAPAIARALVLAAAASGDFAAAFADLKDAPGAVAELWQILATRGDDDSLLAQAVLPPGAALPDIPAGTRLGLARRLVGLGLAGPALSWLGTPPLDPLLAAEAELARRDARAALRLLAGRTDAESDALRLAALRQLEDPALAGLLAARGDTRAGARAMARAGDWDGLAAQGPDLWRRAAALAVAAPQQPDQAGAGPLAQGEALASLSAETRAALAALLSGLPPPDAP